ncbi:MAG: glycerol-3-phosphate dehydrogenase/oxidase [Planctomycetota bacterium]
MIREFKRLNQRFDLLVIGGGIYGAWTAYDAALRGLSVALVERTDWAAGTSSASSKLIHGGLRYLEHGHLGVVCKTLAERSRLLRLAPHRVRKLRFALPMHREARRPAWQLSIGLTIYDLLARAARADRHTRLSGEDMIRSLPWLRHPQLSGGFTYLDAQEDDARMVLELVDGAMQAGAVAVNHAEVTVLLRDAHGRVCGARVRDTLGDVSTEIRAALVINTAGPWANALLPPGVRPAVRHTKGTHIVLPQPAGGMHCAALLTHPRDGRVFFAIPWYGRAMIGTTDTDDQTNLDNVRATDADIDYLLEGLAARCPAAGWSRADVIGSFSGIRTLVGNSSGSASSASREWTLVEPLPGLLQPVGGKFTSARIEAAEMVDRALLSLHKPAIACATQHRLLPWAPPQPWDIWLAEQVAAGKRLALSTDQATTLAQRHGTQIAEIYRRIATDPALAQPIANDLPFLRAEVIHAREREMACTDDDLNRRRIPLAILQRQHST